MNARKSYILIKSKLKTTQLCAELQFHDNYIKLKSFCHITYFFGLTISGVVTILKRKLDIRHNTVMAVQIACILNRFCFHANFLQFKNRFYETL